ncbi:MAG: hypothetical protein M3068_13160 [Gemmatimonadota bacterium]|nr:hypothetical protein [Gemmatimonadota bacterium]
MKTGCRRSALRLRKGMTLLEIIVALGLLVGVVLGMSLYVTQMVHSVGDNDARSIASDLVTDRIETIKGYGVYATLESSYNAVESNVAGRNGWTRTTAILRTQTTGTDYKTVTVLVSAPTTISVKKSTIIAAF